MSRDRDKSIFGSTLGGALAAAPSGNPYAIAGGAALGFTMGIMGAGAAENSAREQRNAFREQMRISAMDQNTALVESFRQRRATLGLGDSDGFSTAEQYALEREKTPMDDFTKNWQKMLKWMQNPNANLNIGGSGNTFSANLGYSDNNLTLGGSVAGVEYGVGVGQGVSANVGNTGVAVSDKGVEGEVLGVPFRLRR
jgi:hypothetical protein